MHYRDASLSQVLGEWTRLKGEEVKILEYARPTEKYGSRFGEFRPMKPAANRKAVGMKSRIHFIRYYIAPMLEKGLIVRTDPDHPKSPQQEYKLA